MLTIHPNNPHNLSCIGNAPKSLQSKTKLGKNQSKPNGDKSTSTPSSPTSFKTQKPANNPKDAPASSPKVRDKVANEGGRDTSANANNANNAIEKSSAMPYEDADAYHAGNDLNHPNSMNDPIHVNKFNNP